MNQRNRMFYDVCFRGKTLKECGLESAEILNGNRERFSLLRNGYLWKSRNKKARSNYYVTGGSAEDRKNVCETIARGMFNDHEDDETFFFVSDKNSAALYDGQPSVVFCDMPPAFISNGVGIKANALNFFDLYPKNTRYRFGDHGVITPSNEVTIISSARPWDEYSKILAECMGVSQRQICSRFDAVVVINDSDRDSYSFMINVGYALKNPEYYTDYAEVFERDGEAYFVFNGIEHTGAI